MESKKHLIEILERFEVSIDGLSRAEADIETFRKKWFLTFKKKSERNFLEQIVSKLQKLDIEFNKELRILLEKEGVKFLKSLDK